MGKNLKGNEIGEGLRQRNDGLYEARFCTHDGKRVSRYFKSLNEAKKWLVDARYNDEHTKMADPLKLNVETWFWYWLDEIKGDTIRYGTRQAYITRFTGRIEPIIGKMVLTDVKPIHCQQVLNHAQKLGDSPGSVRKIRMIMRQFFESAHDNDMIDANPVRSSVTYVKEGPQERRVLTEREQALLLEKAEGHPYYPIYAFALQTGMRVGEIAGLKWDDINFAGRYLSVKRSLEYRKTTKSFVENPPKSKAGIRTIPLTEEAVQILRSVERYDKGVPKVVPYSGLVFLNSEGKPSHRGNYNRHLKKLASDIGMRPLSMHTLRHTFATRCIESGMRPKTLQKILGHSTLNLTMDLFVHVTEDTLMDEMRKFENMQKHA